MFVGLFVSKVIGCCFLLQQSNIPLDRFQLEQLIQKLDREGTGVVDYRCGDCFLEANHFYNTNQKLFSKLHMSLIMFVLVYTRATCAFAYKVLASKIAI